MWWWVAVVWGGEVVPEPALWAGHQVTVVTRSVPLLGNVETRQDVRMLSRVVDAGDPITLVETPCEIKIQSNAAVKLSFPAGAVERIPPPTIRYIAGSDGEFTGEWIGGWDSLDVDGDGKPGFRVRVDAPVCGGSMSVASHTVTRGRATRAGGGLDGSVSIALKRDILSPSHPCLARVPKHPEEAVPGGVADRPVAAGATCSSLLAEGWPVTAAP